MNIIWVIADTFRRDHLGCYGNPVIHTPSLDGLLFPRLGAVDQRHGDHS